METMMDQASAYYPPPESQGGWRRLEDPDQIRALAGMDVEALAPARAWNRQFDVPSVGPRDRARWSWPDGIHGGQRAALYRRDRRRGDG